MLYKVVLLFESAEETLKYSVSSVIIKIRAIERAFLAIFVVGSFLAREFQKI